MPEGRVQRADPSAVPPGTFLDHGPVTVGRVPCWVEEGSVMGEGGGCTSTEEAAALFIKIFYLKASVTKAKRDFVHESHN